MATENNNALDFEDPGMLSDELMNVPGFVNELMNYTMKVAPRPNKPLAFAGALAMLAHLSGRSYRDVRGTRTNLYLAALAPTGMGKDEPRTTNKRLAEAVGILGTVPDSIASGEGLEDAVAKNANLLLQTDEADTLLTAMRGEGGHASKMNEMILRFFSEAKSAHAMRQKAGTGIVYSIPEPHLTMFATGIPKFFYSALTSKSLENGLLGRCLFFESPEFVPFGEQIDEPIPTNIVETARFFVEKEQNYDNSLGTIPSEAGTVPNCATVVTDSHEAERKIKELKFNCDEITRRLMDSELGTAAALYVRIPEKALKLALLFAISENPSNPQITADGVIWATRVVTHLTKRMLYMSQFYVAEGKFDRLKKRVVGMLSSHGGSLDRSTLLKNLGIDAHTFQKIILTLHMADMIEEETLSRRKVVYSLNSAA